MHPQSYTHVSSCLILHLLAWFSSSSQTRAPGCFFSSSGILSTSVIPAIPSPSTRTPVSSHCLCKAPSPVHHLTFLASALRQSASSRTGCFWCSSCCGVQGNGLENWVRAIASYRWQLFRASVEVLHLLITQVCLWWGGSCYLCPASAHFYQRAYRLQFGNCPCTIDAESFLVSLLDVSSLFE